MNNSSFFPLMFYFYIGKLYHVQKICQGTTTNVYICKIDSGAATDVYMRKIDPGTTINVYTSRMRQETGKLTNRYKKNSFQEQYKNILNRNTGV